MNTYVLTFTPYKWPEFRDTLSQLISDHTIIGNPTYTFKTNTYTCTVTTDSETEAFLRLKYDCI
jgi:hypothetical protein